MASAPHRDAAPAHRHDNTALAATAAAAVANGIVFKGIYFNAAGGVDVVDLTGNLETVTGAIGTVYPVQNYGVVTGGGTTLTAGQYLCLH